MSARPLTPAEISALESLLLAQRRHQWAWLCSFFLLRRGSSEVDVDGAGTVGYAMDVGIDVAGFGPHSLRATSATNAFEHGVDIAAVTCFEGDLSRN